MHVPEEFWKMAENFHQDWLLPPDTLEDAARFALHNLSPDEQSRLKAFLWAIISQASEDQLQELWAQTRAEVGFSEGLRLVLATVRDQIDAGRSSGG